MITLFGALSLLFEQLEGLTDYLSDSVSSNYTQITQTERGIVLAVVVCLILLISYSFKVILRLHYNYSTRRLVHVRREFQITLNRAQGKRCNFVWDILLYQKMVILDDPALE